MFDIFIFAQGFALGLGLFVCPGPKDVLILRQALLRQPAAELIAIGVLSDALLIWLGITGISMALSRVPHMQNAALWLGIGLMGIHAFLAARRARLGTQGVAPTNSRATPLARGRSLVTVLAVSLLNPAAWLDTVLVIGTTGAALPLTVQLSFVYGAVTASLTWFIMLVTGARFATRWVTSPKSWQVLDAFVATAMTALAVYLASGLL
jgi:L-lysine exporter family protein LysE/ArgO